MRSGNIEITIYDKADEVMKELSDSLLKRKLVKVGFETLIKVSDSIFDCINFVGLQMS